MNAPNTLLLVGAEGDLATQKLYPALYQLHLRGLLSPELRVIGLSRGRYTREEFLKRLRPKDAGKGDWEKFAARLEHLKGDTTDAESLRGLDLPKGPRIIYLSIPPGIFAAACKAMAEAGLAADDSRVVVEKPLGDSRSDFDRLNDTLLEHFQESQIYRIDHYLGKEAVQNLLALRFANTLFEPIWHHHYVDHVQITSAESAGVGGRWGFYNAVGAMRDMVQNHLLQLLCLISMESPVRDHPRDVRDAKLKVLNCLRLPDPESIGAWSVRGQYRKGGGMCGYGEEEDAGGESNTETFVALKIAIDNPRWHGVPFYLRTGKRLAQRYCEIVVQFKSVAHHIFRTEAYTPDANRLVIRLQPDEVISLHLTNKVPGLGAHTQLHNLGLNLSLDQSHPHQEPAPDAYQRLLLDTIRGNQTLFVRADEVRAAWDWTDGVLEGWKRCGQPLLPYEAGGWGPAQAHGLIARDQRYWYGND